MRVVHIVRQFHPSVGGLEDTVLSLAQAQREQLNLDARVVTLDRVFGSDAALPQAETVAGVPVQRIGWKGSRRYPLAPGVLRHLQQADLLHVHAIDFFFDYLALLRPWHRLPMIATTHGGFFHTPRFRAAKKIWLQSVTRSSVRAYERIVACSYSDADLFRPLAGSRMVLIENGITQEKFGAAAAPVFSKTILSFGRFAKHKRTDQLLRVFATLYARDPDWKLIVAGREGEQSAEELRQLAVEHGLGDSVEFVLNPSNEALRLVMARASFFASLSAYEGFGLAAVEAMSAGLLPILSEIPAFMRLVSAGGVGINVDPDDLDQASSEIQRYTEEQAMPHYEASRGRAMAAASRYDWQEVAARYAGLYHAAIGHGKVLGPITSSGIAD